MIWCDRSCGRIPTVEDKQLKSSYFKLYNLSFDHNITMVEAIEKGWEALTFRRTLFCETLELWTSLKMTWSQFCPGWGIRFELRWASSVQVAKTYPGTLLTGASLPRSEKLNWISRKGQLDLDRLQAKRLLLSQARWRHLKVWLVHRTKFKGNNCSVAWIWCL